MVVTIITKSQCFWVACQCEKLYADFFSYTPGNPGQQQLCLVVDFEFCVPIEKACEHGIGVINGTSSY